MTLHSEILEQPAVLERLLENQASHIQKIARALKKKEIRYVFLAARGTSDNAGLYAKYLWGAFNQLPIALAAPSLFSMYGHPPNLKGALVVGISQSGQSPDIVSVLAEGKRQGAPTLAITNTPGSPLTQVADFCVDIGVGEEKAVAATKTYTAQLMAIAMLSTAWGADQARLQALRAVPGLVEQVLALDKTLSITAERYRYMDQCVVLGRGYNYATAYEWSLKLKELTYVVAGPYSPADFQHGPIAIIGPGFPVMAVVPSGALFENVLALLRRLASGPKAELLIISDHEEALDLARSPVRLPAGIPEWLTPLVSIVPAQLFTYHLTRARGLDPESPRGLQKVTETE